ncbi:MAG: phage late control D family protein [Rhodocyclaceae bacterium]|nr:MAG: phage late control D family protein [Rhodocyclaceae bacterium]
MVKINGQIMPGWIEWEIDNNTFYQADTFHVSFALSMLPSEFSGNWWAKQRTISVEVLAGFPVDPEWFDASELDSLIYGNVDEIEIDQVRGVLELHGRDLTSLLIDTKVTEEFRNKRAWEIATVLAERHGLKPVITKTDSVTGGYYEIDHSRFQIQQSEWDLLTQEAHKERFVVYVAGKELHFEPRPSEGAVPYVLQWEAPTADNASPNFNGMRLSFKRALTVAKGVVVKVSSWNPKTKQKYSVTYPSGHAKGISPGQSSPPATVYPFVRPGLTPEKAMQLAEAYHQEITQHEMKLLADLPGDNLLKAGMPIKMIGSGMEFDQTYYADSVVRRMSIESGYAMSVTAKNVSPDLADSVVGG